MNYRLATILSREQVTADVTKIIDLDMMDAISRLVVTYENDNNPAGAAPLGHPAGCITRIEVVDGSDVIYSLSGKQAQALDFYQSKTLPPNIINYLTGNYSESVFNLNFGRKLFDPELAIDPARFKNLQMKISIDINGGGDAPDDGYLTVLGYLFDEISPAAKGFLMSKESKNYGISANAWEYTDLATDYPYKQIYHRSQQYGVGPDGQIAQIKLSENQDRKIPIDATIGEILRATLGNYPKLQEWYLRGGTTSSEKLYCTMCYWPTFVLSEWRENQAGGTASCYFGDGGCFSFDASAMGPNWQIHGMGWAPHALLPILPCDLQELSSMYNVSGIKNLKLSVKGGASVTAGDTAQIITEQIRNY